MIIKATDFQNNIGKYLQIVQEEEIIITRNGKSIARLVPVKPGDTPISDSLGGILKGQDFDLERVRRERIEKRANPS